MTTADQGTGAQFAGSGVAAPAGPATEDAFADTVDPAAERAGGRPAARGWA